MRQALVFGGSGQIGERLLRCLREGGWQVVAVSRDAQIDDANVRWLRGDLSRVERLPATVDAIFSCGPLDHFARWYANSTVQCPRVVAFGSTSLTAKSESTDPRERALSMRLAEGERVLFAAARRRGAGATALRPTLVYGAGRDQTLTRIASVARRWHCCVLPRGASGLRQPVHVDDLAAAALLSCDAEASAGRAYALPGGETLPYREMVVRVLRALKPQPRLIEVPAPLLKIGMRGAAKLGFRAPGEAAIARLRNDLVFDDAPARRDFAYAPRGFQPTEDMLTAPRS
jgi:nucleoside-diphosphate-sugar epimerase